MATASAFRSRFGILGAIAFALALLATGCGPRDPLDRKVHARGANAVNMWQSRLAGEFSAADRMRIEGALQEIRLKIMGDREATGSAAIACCISLAACRARSSRPRPTKARNKASPPKRSTSPPW